MSMQRFLNHKVISVLAVWMLVLGISPRISFGMPTASMPVVQATASIREAQIEKIMIVLSHPKAQLNLRMAGISQTQLRENLSKLDDAQLAMVAQKADVVRAGGQVELIIGLLVVIILLILLVRLIT